MAIQTHGSLKSAMNDTPKRTAIIALGALLVLVFIPILVVMGKSAAAKEYRPDGWIAEIAEQTCGTVIDWSQEFNLTNETYVDANGTQGEERFYLHRIDGGTVFVRTLWVNNERKQTGDIRCDLQPGELNVDGQ